MLKKGILTGVLLFGLFFGAGNLIFPPNIGVLSGEQFMPAVLGFIVSAVGLATFTLVVSLFTRKGYRNLLSELIHPKFATLFLVVLYLTIGPLFAIPRTATTSFSIGIEPLLSGSGGIGLTVFATIYFIATYWLSVTPNKLLDRVGKILTPIFAGMIILVIVLGLNQLPDVSMNIATSDYVDNWKAFGSGVLEGYNTLDALAAVAFSVVAMNTLKTFGFKSKKEYRWTIVISGMSVAILFSILYLGLALLGNRFVIPENFNGTVGTYILSQMTQRVFGQTAQLFLAVMVIVTCMTTTVGLVVSISSFFKEIFPKLSYAFYVRLFCILGLIIANVGLSTIITLAVPVLLLLYPLTIVVSVLVCVHQMLPLSKIGIRVMVAFVTAVSLIQVASTFEGLSFFKSFIEFLPFNDIKMPWIIFGIIGMLMTVLLPYQKIDRFKYIGE